MNWKYSAIMLAAVATGVILARRTQQQQPLSRVERWGIALGAFCGAMLGAKLPFVLVDWEGLASGATWFADGKTILLGLAGGYLGVEVAKWALDVRIKTGDTFAVPVAAAVAIGRLACFSAGCCYGTHTSLPWAVDWGDGPRHPTQLYEFAFHATAAVVLASLLRRGMFRGQLVKLYIISYAAYRFVSEFVRPEPVVWGGLTAYQWGALALVVVFAGLWRHDARIQAAGGVTLTSS